MKSLSTFFLANCLLSACSFANENIQIEKYNELVEYYNILRNWPKRRYQANYTFTKKRRNSSGRIKKRTIKLHAFFLLSATMFFFYIFYITGGKQHLGSIIPQKKGLSEQPNLVRFDRLYLKARSGNHRMVKDILELKDVDFNTLNDENNQTALHIACQKGHTEVVELLANNKDVDKNKKNSLGNTALHIACQHGHTDVVELLANNKEVDKNIKNLLGNTTLHIACQHGHTDVVELLANNKEVDKNIKNLLGNTALHIACQHGHKKIVEILIEQDIDIDAQNKKGNTSLHIASKYGYNDIVETLIKKNANIKTKNLLGETSFYLACGNIKPKTAKILLQNGATITEDNQGNTPLHAACIGEIKQLGTEQEIKETIDLLQRKKPYLIHARNKKGQSALDAADAFNA